VALAVNEWRETNSLVHFGLATTCTCDAYVEEAVVVTKALALVIRAVDPTTTMQGFVNQP